MSVLLGGLLAFVITRRAPRLAHHAHQWALPGGRLDAGESDAYKFLSPTLRERATRFMPGTMVVAQPVVPEPVPIRFPWPPYATNPDEAKDAGTATVATDIIENLAGQAHPDSEYGMPF